METNIDILQLYKCVPANIVLDSCSWENAKSQLRPASAFLLILFVSHRWESVNDPDPAGQQLGGVRNLIRHVVFGIRAFLAIEQGNHHKHIPDLGRHGVLQGAMIAMRLLATIYGLSPEEGRRLLSESNPERLIGIWYDAACLPQALCSRRELYGALQNLPGFVQHPHVSVVALREPEDDYEQRGWCMMEFMLASRQSPYSPLVYRYDLDGKGLRVNANVEHGLTFGRLLKNWCQANRKTAFKSWQSIFLQANFMPDSIVLDEGKIPVLSIRGNLLRFVALQSGLFVAEKKNHSTYEPLDVMRKLHGNTDLLTTLPDDGVLVYLMILVGGCSLKSDLGKEFKSCLDEVLVRNIYNL